jgi:hypothetical protein
MFYHNPCKPASEAQIRLLQQMGILLPATLNSYQADQLIKANYRRWATLPPTEKQEVFLRNRGKWRPGLTRAEVSELIGDIKGINQWPIGPRGPASAVDP